MTKQQVLAFAAEAQRNNRCVCISVKNRPFRYVGTVISIQANIIQIEGLAYGFGLMPHSGNHFVRASGVTITDGGK